MCGCGEVWPNSGMLLPCPTNVFHECFLGPSFLLKVLKQCMKKNCSWNNIREHDVCFSASLSVRWAIEMELDIAHGEFFVPAAFFTPPPFSTGEKQCVQNDTKWKRPNWNLRNTFYYYLHLALKNYAAHSTIFYQPFRSKGQKQQRETTRAYYTCTHIRKEGGGDLPWKVLCPLEWHYRTWQIIWHSDLINIGFLWWFRAFIKLNYRSGRALSLSLFFFSWTLSTLIA